MAYTPNTWAKGDTISSAKLNHIEEGVRYADEYVDRIKDAIDELEAGSLSAVGADEGTMPVADGEGTWEWKLNPVAEEVRDLKSAVDGIGTDLEDLETYTKGGPIEDETYETVDGYTIDFNTGATKAGNRITVLDFLPVQDADYIEVVCTDETHSSKYDQGYKIYEYSDDNESSYLGAHRSGDNWYWTDDNPRITPEKLEHDGEYIRLVFYSGLTVTVKAHYNGRRTGGLVERVASLEDTAEDVDDEIQGTKADLENLSDEFKKTNVVFDDIVLGTIDSSTGQDADNTKRCRTNGYISLKDFNFCDITEKPDYQMMVFLYEDDKTYIGRIASEWNPGRLDRITVNEETYPDAAYIRFLFRRADGGVVSQNDMDAMKDVISSSGYTPSIAKSNIIRQIDVLTKNTANIEKQYAAKSCINIEKGSINSEGSPTSSDTRCRTADYIDIDEFICCETAGTGYTIYVFLYDANHTFLVRTPITFMSVNVSQIAIKAFRPETKYLRIIFNHNNANITDADLIAVRGFVYLKAANYQLTHDKARFDKQFNYVAYSHLSSGDAPYNTEEHFLKCANMGGFTALKGDVRPTLDGGLIMCHDAGYTFDANNKITSYDKNNCTNILTLTVAQCKALTFAQQYENKDCHPIDFETFVCICKKYGLICYVTVRDEAIAATVAPETLRILKKYRMLDRCIINSFTKETLEIYRALNPTVMLSMVLDHWAVPTEADVDYVYSLGNCILNLFTLPLPESEDTRPYEQRLDELLSTQAYADVLDYAYGKNVIVYDAQAGTACIDVLLKHGITGLHMTAQPVYDYKRE